MMTKMMRFLLMATLGLTALISLYGAMPVEAAEKELLTNPGFEIQEPGSMAPGWQAFQGSFGNQLVFENHPVYEGDWSFAIYDNSSTKGYGLRSSFFPASPGQVYEASVMAMTEQNCQAYLYLDFTDANGNRVKDRVVYTTSPDWEKLTVSMEAPEGTAFVSIILYTKVAPTGIARYDNASLKLIYEDTGMGAEKDLTVDAKALDHSPAKAATEIELLTNPGFEIQEPGSMAPGWQVFQGSFGNQLVFENHPVYEGNWSFAIHDTSPNDGYGIRSSFFPASPGQVYKASVMAMTEKNGLAYLHLDFTDADGNRVKDKAVFTPNSNWEKLTATMEAPEGTAFVSIILYSKVNITGIARFDNASLALISEDAWIGDGIDLIADAETLDYSPANGAVVTTNPPSFVWIPVPNAESYILEYSTDPQFTPAHTVTVPNIDISIYTPAELFDNTKTWYWRVRAVDRRGNISPPSVTRAFNIDVNAVSLPLPPLSEVRAQIPTSHPRLFVRPENLEEWRQKPNSDDLLYKHLWSSLRTKALNALYEILPAEPPHCAPGGVWDVNLWRQYSITTKATDTMELLAFAYMMTGDKIFGDAARRWMLHIASWDPSPNGATSAAVNDESSMPILLQMSRAYTWAYDALSPEDREVIRNVMRIRGNEAYQILKQRKFESRPYASHAGRSLGFLGEAAIAFMGEIPEAQEWFDYVVRIFYAIYPAWGGDPGGWAEGHSYWTSYMNRVLWFVDALREATGLDLFQKAFFQNTGTFKLYTQPPYSKMGPFGDLSDRGPTPDAGVVMNLFAAVYNNPYYKWYAEKMGYTAEMRVMGYIRAILHDSRGVSSKAPIDLPPSTYFPDIGWTVFHKQLGVEAKDSIQFMFKSSPYGSYSHSFADQNTFTLEAYEEPLAISSGYRPWYGSQHHRYWTKTTQAHNGVLVNGKGQQEQSLAAKGRIIGFLNGESFDYTAGEAHMAYGASLLERYLRHVVYIRPDVFVLYDDLKAPKASTYSWLLHSYHQMSVEEGENEGQHMGHIHLEAEKAYLDAYLWADGPLFFSQTNQFAVPLDEPMDKPEQWHLTATTNEAKPEGSFLAVLAPGKKGADGKEQGQSGQPILLLEKVAAGEAGEGVRLLINEDEAGAAGNASEAAAGAEEVLVLFRRGETPRVLEVGEARSDAVVAAWRGRGDGTYGLLVADGTFWHSGYGFSLDAEALISAELTFSPTCINGTILHPAVPGSKPYKVTLQLPEGKGAGVKAVSSSHQLLDWSLAGDSLLLTLAPGEHKLTVSLDIN